MRNIVVDDAVPSELRLLMEKEATIVLARFDSIDLARHVMSIVERVVSVVKPRPKVNLELYQGDSMLDAFDQTDELEESGGFPPE